MSDFLFCHGCGRRLVRVSKVDDRHRCSYCWATWTSTENYAKGIEGREPFPAQDLADMAENYAKKEGII